MKTSLVTLTALLSILTFSQATCYEVGKQYIESNLEEPTSLLIDIGTLYQSSSTDAYSSVVLDLNTSQYIPYLSSARLTCNKETVQNRVDCSGDCDGGHISIEKRKDGVYFKFQTVRMAETPDDPIIYEFSGRTKHFVKAKEIPCYRSMHAIVSVKNFEQDAKKDRLIHSLEKEKNIIIYDIDYQGDSAISVGEDNSIETRKTQAEEENYRGIVLRTVDNGKHWERLILGDLPLTKIIMLNRKEAVMMSSMEGAGGIIRYTSNGGKKWKEVYSGHFLYDMTMHMGSVFAVGYGILKSDNGKKWIPVPTKEFNELYAIASIDKNRLVVTSGEKILLSDDHAKSWKNVKLPSGLVDSSTLMEHIYTREGKVYVWARHPDGFLLQSNDNAESWQYVQDEE